MTILHLFNLPPRFTSLPTKYIKLWLMCMCKLRRLGDRHPVSGQLLLISLSGDHLQ